MPPLFTLHLKHKLPPFLFSVEVMYPEYHFYRYRVFVCQAHARPSPACRKVQRCIAHTALAIGNGVNFRCVACSLRLVFLAAVCCEL